MGFDGITYELNRSKQYNGRVQQMIGGLMLVISYSSISTRGVIITKKNTNNQPIGCDSLFDQLFMPPRSVGVTQIPGVNHKLKMFGEDMHHLLV